MVETKTPARVAVVGVAVERDASWAVLLVAVAVGVWAISVGDGIAMLVAVCSTVGVATNIRTGVGADDVVNVVQGLHALIANAANRRIKPLDARNGVMRIRPRIVAPLPAFAG